MHAVCGVGTFVPELIDTPVIDRWRRPSDTNAEQLQRRSTDTGITANVIEGEPHDAYWGV
jgi:hypothetical protein